MPNTDYKIIVHCSASDWGTPVIITEWHRQRWGHLVPKGKTPLGYNGVIENGFPTFDHSENNEKVRLLDGAYSTGRAIDTDNFIEAHEFGAHAYGFNQMTLGLCLIGNKWFTKNQIIMAVKVIRLWMSQFDIPVENVLGHCELPGVTKTCPNLDMDWLRDLVRNKIEGFALLKAQPNIKGV